MPVTDAEEAASLLQHLPIALDREKFLRFVIGFPREYLINTPRNEIVKHYFLFESLPGKQVISSLSLQQDLWKLSLVTLDRHSLFSRICGTLSCFGMNIVSAKAFANANSLVLDTFFFSDPEEAFTQEEQRRHFQHFLEEVVEGKKDLEPLLESRLKRMSPSAPQEWAVEFEIESHPSATLLLLDCHDHFGLLYRVARCISAEGHDIEMAYVQTPGRRVHDEFYLSHEGSKLSPAMQENLKQKLIGLGKEYMDLGPSDNE